MEHLLTMLLSLVPCTWKPVYSKWMRHFCASMLGAEQSKNKQAHSSEYPKKWKRRRWGRETAYWTPDCSRLHCKSLWTWNSFGGGKYGGKWITKSLCKLQNISTTTVAWLLWKMSLWKTLVHDGTPNTVLKNSPDQTELALRSYSTGCLWGRMLTIPL